MNQASINERIAKRFANPRGVGGRIVMAVTNRQNAQMHEATEKLLHPQNGDTILDIGCGNGIMMERIARACDCHLIGTDMNQIMGISDRHDLLLSTLVSRML